VRLNATVWRNDGSIANSEILTSSIDNTGRVQADTISIPPDGASVTLRKLNEGFNYGGGTGAKVLTSSVFTVHSIRTSLKLEAKKKRERVIEYVGASDTAGYCVDGNPAIEGAELYIEG
jgi:hypothetical protein